MLANAFPLTRLTDGRIGVMTRTVVKKRNGDWANDQGPPLMTPFREGDNGPTAEPMGASEVVMLDGFRNNAFLSKHERAQE